ncbi:MAG: serine/threonine protein kinase [Myxococcota bacterium]|nr:serine/threonine protein kinase [Myxococcota bacterium]
MGGPAKSRRLLAQAHRAWGGSHNEEESRAYLQARLNVYSKTLFWAFVTLLSFIALTYKFVLPQEPALADYVFGGSAGVLAMMAVLWRTVLARRELDVRSLYRIDLLYAITVGVTLALSAALQPDLRPAGYTSLVFAGYTIFTRALLVPSSPLRTAVAASITFVPVMASGVYLAFTSEQDLPPSAYIGGGLTFTILAIIIAANGSGIIYGLRQQVSEAMQLGQYTLDRKIGEGGMGTVYRARHALLRRPTAIKLLLPDRVGGTGTLDRFEREVQHMSQLTHPNTVAVFDYGRSPDGVLYYAMEYLGGIDLEHLVRNHGPQPASRVVHILMQVCGALQEAHDAKIIHRDIKPANIILCERGGLPDFAKVVDFGLVKEITRDTTASTQVILGTPAYVAPEAITDPDRIGPAVDLYALGAVGYYLLTGKRMFDGKTAVEICIQHVTQVPKRPSEVAGVHVPRDLEAIVMKCLEKRPEDRFGSATELAEALARLPPSPDWDRAAALRWWRDFKELAAQPPPSETPTLTMTIDLDRRT